MALMKPGPLGTPSGALGTIVFYPKRGSVTVAQPKKHTRRTSRLTLAAQNETAFWSRAWMNSAMDTYREAWRVWADNNPTVDRFGTPRYRTPKQAFLHYVPQMKVQQITASPPPTNEEPCDFSSYSYTFNTISGLTIHLDTPNIILNLILVTYIARWQGPVITSKRPSWLAPPTPVQLAGAFSYGAPLAIMGHEPVEGEIWRVRLICARSTGKPSQTFDFLTDPCVVPP